MYKTIILSLAVAATASPLLVARGQCGEGTAPVCYGVEGGESQNINPDDIQYIADYLRYLDEENSGSNKF